MTETQKFPTLLGNFSEQAGLSPATDDSAERSIPASIALIGFMGCGKTTVGRLLASRLGFSFVDTDIEIERAAGCSIPELFRTEGEAAFRRRETVILQTVTQIPRRVIATGGGVPLRPENTEVLQAQTWVVWLTARPDVIVQRTGRDAASRPILAAGGDNLLTHVLRLLGERGPRYQAAAHLVVDTSDRPPAAVATEIARKWEKLTSV